MGELTKEMREYEKVCATFRAAGIEYKELDTKGYLVTFQLSKNGSQLTTIIDCSSELVEQHTLNAVASFEKLLEWERKENEKKAKRR